MNRTTKDIIKEIQNANKILHTDIESIPFGHRPGFKGSMIQASESLPKLLEEIEKIVFPGSLVGLFAFGDEESIGRVGIVLNKTEGIVLDAQKFYQTIADLVEPSYGTDRLFCTTQYGLMIQQLKEIATDLGYLEIVPPPFIEKVCPKPQDTLLHVRNCLRDCNVGDQANVDLLKKEIVDKIVKEEIESKQIPVMVTNTLCADEQNHIAILFNKSNEYTFKPDFEPTIKNIISIFKGQEPTKENE